MTEVEKEREPFYQMVEKYEKEVIKVALKLTGGNITNAARFLKMNRSTLSEMIKRYGLRDFLPLTR